MNTLVKNGKRVTQAEDVLSAIRDALTDQVRYRDYNDVTVKREGAEIIIPSDMTYDHAAKWLLKKSKEEEKIVEVSHEINAYPPDGLVAVSKAVEVLFGFGAVRGSVHPFFGEMTPRMLSVPISTKEHVEVTMDRLEPPALEGGTISTTYTIKNGVPLFVVQAEIKRKHQGLVTDFVDLVRSILRTDSIYKGRAIKVDLAWADRPEDFHPLKDSPTFMDVSGDTMDSLILNETTEFDLVTSVLMRIERTQDCLTNKIPLKHGVVLSGPYGTGKTLTAKVVANRCEANNWTFIYVKKSSQIVAALRLAKLYAPAVVFAEDIDRVVTGERTTKIDEILNTLDGIDTKNSPILTILTTNNHENIHPGFMRAGRIDSFIHVGKPDAKAAVRFVYLYGKDEHGNSIIGDIDQSAVGEALSNMVPAFISEAVHRAKAYAMYEDREYVETADLVKAAHGLREHVAYVEGEDTTGPSASEAFVLDITERTAEAVKKHLTR